VMMTSMDRPGPVEQAKAAGATAWVFKPFPADLLLAAVNKLVGA
jgi:CheY-like chemotaxis protein